MIARRARRGLNGNRTNIQRRTTLRTKQPTSNAELLAAAHRDLARHLKSPNATVIGSATARRRA